jgi:hypothetical protein
MRGWYRPAWLRSSVSAGVAQSERGVDRADMAEGLRDVAKLAACGRFTLLGQELHAGSHEAAALTSVRV